MTSAPRVSDPHLVRHVMGDAATFIPHLTEFPVAGATLRLREQMARFSGPDRHPARRDDVVQVIERVDVLRAETLAQHLTDAALDRGDDVDRVASTVPTLTLSRLLGLEIDGASLVADVEEVVRVIGRGAPPSEASDAATERLLGLAEDEPTSVAVVSALYQNFDATAAAVRAAETARRHGASPAPAVERTRRVATVETTVGGTRVDAGGEVVLEIAEAGFPFGTGPHECPGRLVAEAIVRGVMAAIESEAG